MKKRFASASLALAIVTLALPIPAALAQSGHNHGSMNHGEAMTPAEVRALDLKAGKLTLKHGELKDLGMPPMTMVFTIKKGLSLPADLKVGDKVQVRVEDVGGTLTVTQLKR